MMKLDICSNKLVPLSKLGSYGLGDCQVTFINGYTECYIIKIMNKCIKPNI